MNSSLLSGKTEQKLKKNWRTTSQLQKQLHLLVEN